MELHVKAQDAIVEEIQASFSGYAVLVNEPDYERTMDIIDNCSVVDIEHLGESHGASDKRCFFEYKDEFFCFDFAQSSEEAYFEDSTLHKAKCIPKTVMAYEKE